MSYFNDPSWKPNFNMHPVFEIGGTQSAKGYAAIADTLKKRIAARGGQKTVVVFDYYYGINEQGMLDGVIGALGAATLLNMEEAHYPEAVIQEKFGKYITDDRIMGVFAVDQIDAHFDPEKVARLKKQIDEAAGLVVLYGVAASIVTRGDILVYCEIPKQSIQERYKAGMPNWGAGNGGEEQLKKEKRLQFVEGRILNWHKQLILNDFDYIVDCHDDLKGQPVMIDMKNFDKMVRSIATRPFTTMGSWTPSIWGGKWAQKVLGADPTKDNIGWAMPGNIDRFPMNVRMGGNEVTLEAMDLVYYLPKQIIGPHHLSVHGYSGILVVNYLDTWGGGNLSLQVHPTYEYGKRTFNMEKGHHESYYIMDAGEKSHVYLGVKTGVTLDELVDAFKEAQETGTFDEDKYLNNFPVQKHDHVYVPAGTVHASGTDTVVLEINAYSTQTFKLWDWGRVDYDGKPRPINIEHGRHCIDMDFNTEVSRDQLLSKKQEVDRGVGWRKEFSGVSPYAPYSVYRYWVKSSVTLETKKELKVHVLVEGAECVVESPDHAFEPYVAHYGEVFYIPAGVGQYTIRPYGKAEGQEIAFVEAYMCYNR